MLSVLSVRSRSFRRAPRNDGRFEVHCVVVGAEVGAIARGGVQHLGANVPVHNDAIYLGRRWVRPWTRARVHVVEIIENMCQNTSVLGGPAE